jgi:hypothetical protein
MREAVHDDPQLWPYIDGKELIDFLVEQNAILIEPHETRCGGTEKIVPRQFMEEADTRRLYDARQGAYMTATVVDRILIRLGFHLLELPDSAFRKEKPRAPVIRFTDEQKRQIAVESLTEFDSVVAKRWRCSSRSVKNWRDAFGLSEGYEPRSGAGLGAQTREALRAQRLQAA